MQNVTFEDALARLQACSAHSVDLMCAPLSLRDLGVPEEMRTEALLRHFQLLCGEFARLLSSDGSLLLEVSRTWLPGGLVRNPFPYELLVHLCKPPEAGGAGWHLAQELFRYEIHPLLPSAVAMVEVGQRFPDTVFPVWWLSRSPYPRADNRRVLRPYSEAQRRLMHKGDRAGQRPSGHRLGGTFGRDNGGAIPSNLIAPTGVPIGGTVNFALGGSQSDRPSWPPTFLEFVIKLCTEQGGRIAHPFALTDEPRRIAEGLGRRWIAFAPK